MLRWIVPFRLLPIPHTRQHPNNNKKGGISTCLNEQWKVGHRLVRPRVSLFSSEFFQHRGEKMHIPRNRSLLVRLTRLLYDREDCSACAIPEEADQYYSQSAMAATHCTTLTASKHTIMQPIFTLAKTMQQRHNQSSPQPEFCWPFSR